MGAEGMGEIIRRATDSTVENGLLQLLQLAQQADGVKRVGDLCQFLLLLGRQGV